MDLSPCSDATGLRMVAEPSSKFYYLHWMRSAIRGFSFFGCWEEGENRYVYIPLLHAIPHKNPFQPEFSSVPSAVLKTAVMMIGELEFTAIFHGDVHVHPERLFGPAIAYPLFLFFCVIMTILLMNLLVCIF
ncbi:unnamed protein product [Strongylus vulgaris]|uniref:Ion transport domain-containing protein n=1 Tax=Strongylus vulgaris TaxID=40348 RepID=A0A3P7JC96_STRVU|nr:unnamed protein product [Strongylus vulgaris]